MRGLLAPPARAAVVQSALPPHDNPVERIWASLKAWPANSPTLTMAGRDQPDPWLRPTVTRAAASDRRTPQLALATQGYGQHFRARLESLPKGPPRWTAGHGMAEPPTATPDPAAPLAPDELLATKLNIPRSRPDLLGRARLIQRLSQGWPGK